MTRKRRKPGPKPKPVVECGVELYRIRVGDETSDSAEFGDPCTLETDDGNVYVACIHETSDGQRLSLLDSGYVVRGAYSPCGFSTLSDEDITGYEDDSYNGEDADDADDEDTDEGGEDEDLPDADAGADADSEDDEDSDDEDSDDEDETEDDA